MSDSALFVDTNESGIELNKASYNLIAQSYASEHAQLAWQPELDKFISLIETPNQIIDLGCGPGDETIYIHTKLPTAKVRGVDFSDNMIDLARVKNRKIVWVDTNIVTYQPKVPINAIWARGSFHHLNTLELHKLFDRVAIYRAKDFVLGMVNKLGLGEEIEEKEKYGATVKRYFNYFNEDKVNTLIELYDFERAEEYVKEEGGHKFLVTFLRAKPPHVIEVGNEAVD
jgi:SAM-dependent methyltransferase